MKKLTAILLAALMLTSMVAFSSCTQPADDLGNEVEGEIQQGEQQGEKEHETKNSDLAYIQDKGKLIVGITDYAPMNYLDDEGKWTGFDTEFALAVAEKLGVEVEFIEIDWDNKIMELDSKAIDCVWNGMTLTNEVLSAMNCSTPYVVNAQVVVMDKEKLGDYTTVEDLADVTFVAEAGSAGAAAIADAGYTAVEVGTQTDALMEVAAGAEDACVIDITMANAMTGEGTSYANLGYAISLTEEEYGIGFRKDSDTTAKVNEIIAELKADGTLTALAEKYELTLAE